MKQLYAIPLAVMLTVLPGYGSARAMDSTLPTDGRIKKLVYDANDVYTITTRYGYQTNLVFGRNEAVEIISMGDRSLWQIIPAGNRLFIRPMDAGVETNMTILTNKRSYQFDLRSLADDSKERPLYVAEFVYPDEQPGAPEPMVIVPEPQPEPAPVAIMEPEPKPVVIETKGEEKPPFARVSYHYNYTYSGPDKLAPVKVFDDGASTFLEYRSLPKESPKAFVRGPDGGERAVTYYRHNNQLVIEEVAAEIVLKHTGGTVVIYNEMLNPDKPR